MDGAKLRYNPFVLSGLDQLQKQPGTPNVPGDSSGLSLKVASDQRHRRLVTSPHAKDMGTLTDVQDLIPAHQEILTILIHTASVDTVEAMGLDDLEARSERSSETTV